MTLGRDAFSVKLGRLFQRLPFSWLRLVEWPFVYGRVGTSEQPCMVMLLALPRSGSTLTYQVLVHALQPRYLSNFGNLFFQLPLLGGLVSRRICYRHRSDFHSNQGLVAGLCGPAEGLQFWRYWQGYRLDERQQIKVDVKRLSRRNDYLRRVFSLLSCPEKPMISGFLGHSLEPQRLQQEFPRAIFIRLHRDILSTALSLLHCRRESKQEWFSLFPEECVSHLGEGEHAEVAAQIYWLSRRLDDGLCGNNVFHLDYEALCRDPQKQVQSLIAFCNKRGFALSQIGDLPGSFESRNGKTGADGDVEKLQLALECLEKRYGALRYHGESGQWRDRCE